MFDSSNPQPIKGIIVLKKVLIVFTLLLLLSCTIAISEEVFYYKKDYTEIKVQSTEQKNLFFETVTDRNNSWATAILVQGNALIFVSEEGEEFFRITPQSLGKNKLMQAEYTAIMQYFSRK